MPTPDDALVAEDAVATRALLTESTVLAERAHEIAELAEDSIDAEERAALIELLRHVVTRVEHIAAILELRSVPPA
jgi:hypothetical protein